MNNWKTIVIFFIGIGVGVGSNYVVQQQTAYAQDSDIQKLARALQTTRAELKLAHTGIIELAESQQYYISFRNKQYKLVMSRIESLGKKLDRHGKAYNSERKYIHNGADRDIPVTY